MRNLEKDYEHRVVDVYKLLCYGFKKVNDTWIYKHKLCEDTFEIVVEISDHKKTSKLIDLACNEEYILVDVQSSMGEFIGNVKEEYNSVLNDIINKCSTPNFFKTGQSKEIIKYVKDQYNDDLEYLWKNSKTAIWRNKKNNKWYGLMLVVEESKLSIESNKLIEALNLRYQKSNIDSIIDNKKIFKGYHMNKKNWITIPLDGSMDIKKIYELIDNSYNISLEKK